MGDASGGLQGLREQPDEPQSQRGTGRTPERGVEPQASRVAMAYKGGRLELLVPHMLRGQLLRPGFVRLSLRLGAARAMPSWAKLLFINSGVSLEDLNSVLR